MKKQLITIAFLFLTCLSALAQKEYKLTKSTGKLYINLNGAIIEGYDGNEIIFSGQRAEDEEEDERAKGLQAISSSGQKDNTGLGINVTEKGQEVHVNIVGNRIDNRLLTIRVPKQMAIVFTYDKTFYAEPVTIRNIKGEIELTTTDNNIILENNSGPMNVTTIRGSIDATFENDIKGPVSIISIYKHVDVALPTATKANVELGTHYGKLYAANEFDIVVEKDTLESKKTNNTVYVDVLGTGQINSGTTPPAVILTGHRLSDTTLRTPPTPPTAVSATSYSRTISGVLARVGPRELIKGTINGGGNDLIFKSTHSNVYLRTK